MDAGTENTGMASEDEAEPGSSKQKANRVILTKKMAAALVKTLQVNDAQLKHFTQVELPKIHTIYRKCQDDKCLISGDEILVMSHIPNCTFYMKVSQRLSAQYQPFL